MRKLLVVKPDIAAQRGLQLFARLEMMALQHIFAAAIEPFYHAVGLWRLRRGRTVLDVQGGAKRVELMPAGCTPSRTSLRTDLAMKKADRRGSM